MTPSDRIPETPRAKRARIYAEAGVTEREAWSRILGLALGITWLALKVVVPVVALLGGHWQYALLLGLTLISARRYHGFIVICYFVEAAVFTIGVAGGLAGLAFFGVLLPEAIRLVMLFALGDRYGVPRVPLFRVEHPPKDDAARALETRQYKLAQWRERIRAAPADRGTVEKALFDMRDWDMTPSQAVRVACRAGAPRELVDEIVRDVILWPRLEEPRHLDNGWKWERTIELPPEPPGEPERG